MSRRVVGGADATPFCCDALMMSGGSGGGGAFRLFVKSKLITGCSVAAVEVAGAESVRISFGGPASGKVCSGNSI